MEVYKVAIYYEGSSRNGAVRTKLDIYVFIYLVNAELIYRKKIL